MKKLIALLVIMTGFMFTDLSAQSCCTTKKECKPKQCCPTKPNCCKETKSLGSSAEANSTVEGQQITTVNSNSAIADEPKSPAFVRRED